MRESYGRKVINLEGKNENLIARNCFTPLQNYTSSQRRDLMEGFYQSMIIPCITDKPIMDSCLSADLLKHSSCIHELNTGKIKLVGKYNYQLRTLYIYIHNNEVKIYDDNSGTVISQKAVNNMKTDLDLLELNKEYDLDDKESDSLYIKYPEFFNPANGLYGFGRNILSTIGTEFDNSQDSVAVSKSFVNKFISRKTKSVTVGLKNKKILSKWEDLFPPIGTIIEDEQFLFKVVSSEGDMYVLAQSSDLPAGEEDDTVVTYLNSMLVSVEVYSNEPIEDPVLERYRKELISFKYQVRTKLNELKQRGFNLSNEAKMYLENYSYTKVRTNKEIITDPIIVIRIDDISRPSVGSKFSNRYGGKYTVQKIYEDDAYTDEFGRSIECCYSAAGIINRLNPSTLFEVWFTGINEHIRRTFLENKVTIKQIRDFYKYYFEILEIPHDFEEMNKQLSDDDWKEIITNSSGVPIIFLPVSEKDLLRKCALIRRKAKELFNYRKLKVKHSKNDRNIKYSTVGYLYTVRLCQDPTTQTSAVANPEIDKRNIIKDDDENKKKGLSIHKRKASKHCVQTNHLSLNMVPDAVLYESIVGGDDIMSTVEENCNAIGIDLHMMEKLPNDEE